MSLTERFWAKVERSEGCWIWTGARNRRGYGKIRRDARTFVSAHRLSYEMANGSVPDGLFVCHHCDNPSCVRPDHLFTGTVGDNNRDTIRKGRRPHTYPPRVGVVVGWQKHRMAA